MQIFNQATSISQLPRPESEVADFFAALRGLLLKEDVAAKIAALPEPLKGIAEEAQAKIRGAPSDES